MANNKVDKVDTESNPTLVTDPEHLTEDNNKAEDKVATWVNIFGIQCYKELTIRNIFFLMTQGQGPPSGGYGGQQGGY